MITKTVPLDNIQQAFEELDASPNAIKVLLDCRA